MDHYLTFPYLSFFIRMMMKKRRVRTSKDFCENYAIIHVKHVTLFLASSKCEINVCWFHLLLSLNSKHLFSFHVFFLQIVDYPHQNIPLKILSQSLNSKERWVHQEEKGCEWYMRGIRVSHNYWYSSMGCGQIVFDLLLCLTDSSDLLNLASLQALPLSGKIHV